MYSLWIFIEANELYVSVCVQYLRKINAGC